MKNAYLLMLLITLLVPSNVVQRIVDTQTNISVYTKHLSHNYINTSVYTDHLSHNHLDHLNKVTNSKNTVVEMDAIMSLKLLSENSNPYTFQHPILAVENNPINLSYSVKQQPTVDKKSDFLTYYLAHFTKANTIEIKPKAIDNLKNKKNLVAIDHIDYWQTLHSIESKQGKLLFRPRNKARNCDYTTAPCGHHQLTVQALKDIGCKSLQCRKDRLDYKKSLKLSKKLLALNEKRLKKHGITNLKGYQKYLIHQQGATGIKSIIAATQGKKTLSKRLKKNMANNSPFSYKQLKRMSSKVAANKFMQHWEDKWLDEKRLIVASQATTSTDSLIEASFIPKFDDKELNLALNIQF